MFPELNQNIRIISEGLYDNHSVYICVLCLYIWYFIAWYSVYTAYKLLLFVKCLNVYKIIC